MRRSFVAIATLFLAACTTEPTKTSVTQTREYVAVQAKAEKPLDVQEETTVLDTRSNFVYGLNHVRNSLYFPWTNLSENPAKGEILRDAHQAALRLALIGLNPQAPVLIVGDGARGQGEEGRLAWTLLYFGFQDVQVASTEALRAAMTQDPSPPAKNVPTPKLDPNSDLQISLDDFKKLVKAGPQALAAAKTVIIDVRSAAEAAKGGFTNLEWKTFYTPQGRPDWRVKKKLEARGITNDWRVVVISNRGVRSAAAAYALIALGFKNVQNFTGGFQAL